MHSTLEQVCPANNISEDQVLTGTDLNQLGILLRNFLCCRHSQLSSFGFHLTDEGKPGTPLLIRRVGRYGLSIQQLGYMQDTHMEATPPVGPASRDQQHRCIAKEVEHQTGRGHPVYPGLISHPPHPRRMCCHDHHGKAACLWNVTITCANATKRKPETFLLTPHTMMSPSQSGKI